MTAEDVEPVDLVEETAAEAIAHAVQLLERLRKAGDTADSALGACRDEAHRLIGDIVSLRNAAELLKRSRPVA
jgi:hypothetical protein